MPWGMALLLAVAMVGIYHNPHKVGEDYYDFQLTTERLDRQHDTDDQVEIGTQQKKISFAALACIGVYLAFIAKPTKRWVPNELAWLVAAGLVWALLSYFWSFEKPVTLRESVRLSVGALVAYGIARNYRPNQALFLALAVCGLSVATALCSELLAGILQPWTAGYRLKGGMHANMLAVHAAFFVMAAVCLSMQSRYRMLLLFAAAGGVAVLLLTKSRSAVAAFLMGMLLIWTMRLDPRRAAMFWSKLVVAIAVLMLTVAIAGPGLARLLGGAALMGRQENIGSLTGRLPLWHTVMDDIAKRPLIGHGYEAFWTAERRESIAREVQWYPTDAHSIYVNTLVELGLIGLTLNLICAIWAQRKLVRKFRSTPEIGYIFFAALIGFALFHGITEAGCSAARISGPLIGVGVLLAAGLGHTTAHQASHETD